jgi:hypothetical protein
MEKQEFVFPDEKETEKKDVDIPAAEIDIEIVDDTPEEDRNRPPMKEPPEEVSDEELQNYSDGVKKRIQHFTKGGSPTANSVPHGAKQKVAGQYGAEPADYAGAGQSYSRLPARSRQKED